MQSHIYNKIQQKDNHFPFKTQFSLHKLIENWRQKANSDDLFEKEKAALLLHQLDRFPTLKEPVNNPNDHKGDLSILKHLFSDVYAVDFQEFEALSITTPFIFEHLFQTDKFSHIMENIDHEDEKFQKYLENRILISRLIHAYNFIFESLYGLELQATDIPLVIPYRNPVNGLIRYFTEQLFTQFIDIKVEDLNPLSSAQIDELLSNYSNTELWQKYLPTDKISFSGVGLLKLNDITERESLARLQSVLLEDSLITSETINKLEKILSNFLELPNIKIGLIAYDDYLDLYKIDQNIWSSVLMKSGVNFSHKKLKKLFIDKLKTENDIIQIQTSQKNIFSDSINEGLQLAGTNSLMIAPLFKNEDLFGILEISSAENINMGFLANKLTNVLPLFELAAERSLESVNNKVQTIIKDNCTAIHPAVEWKFSKLALRAYKDSNYQNEIPDMQDIIFKQVYPLYGNIDIRESSIKRNRAIYTDLETQLNLALESVNQITKNLKIRILEHLKYSLEEKLEDHRRFPGVQDGDDTYTYLQSEVNPVFRQLTKDSRIDQNWVNYYLHRLDPVVGFVYEERKFFEKSVTRINNIIGSKLDKDQIYAQNIYPHYFEAFKTDGVEYTIFIGQSISPKISFTEVYLKNLRLWQLENMANIVQTLQEDYVNLEMKLKTAQLIYVQNALIDIKFKYEEKRFDVDGTFNARFEIVKKRLDKAMLLGKNERLTQPNKIAIVYNQNAIMGEYLDYIDYLQHKKLLSEEVEFLELENMHGAEGLKAIRVSVLEGITEENSYLITQESNSKQE